MFVYVNFIHIYEVISTSFFEFFYVLFVVYLRAFRHFYDAIRPTNLDPPNHPSDDHVTIFAHSLKEDIAFLQGCDIVGVSGGCGYICTNKTIKFGGLKNMKVKKVGMMRQNIS